jgi:DNA polymerase-3 subunit gamma/tau
MLDHFRDLIVLSAVPEAAEIGLLDLAPDRAERMAAQAGRFGQAGLTRAAELINTGLDQMRGATSPRLLLELMCAQVLLPAATTDEKSLLTRLERLESAGRGTLAPAPQSPPRAPHPRHDDHAERAGVPAPGEPRAPESTRARPASDRSADDRPAAPRQAPVPPPQTEQPPARTDAESGPASVTPAAAAPAAPPAAEAPRAAATPAGSSGAPSAGQSPADSLRQNWDAVLEAIKRERRVAWMLLSNASVVSVQDGILTLRFAREGDLKGFSSSGCDADLKRVLSSGFGLNVMVKGVTGGDPGASGQGFRPGGAGSGGQGSGGQRASSPAAAARPAAAQPAAAYDDLPPDEMPSDEDEMPPDDEPSGYRSAPAEPELTGMDLIQRELGGQVISEIEG